MMIAGAALSNKKGQLDSVKRTQPDDMNTGRPPRECLRLSQRSGHFQGERQLPACLPGACYIDTVTVIPEDLLSRDATDHGAAYAPQASQQGFDYFFLTVGIPFDHVEGHAEPGDIIALGSEL